MPTIDTNDHLNATAFHAFGSRMVAVKAAHPNRVVGTVVRGAQCLCGACDARLKFTDGKWVHP